jgi:hypothetical protein
MTTNIITINADIEYGNKESNFNPDFSSFSRQRLKENLSFYISQFIRATGNALNNRTIDTDKPFAIIRILDINKNIITNIELYNSSIYSTICKCILPDNEQFFEEVTISTISSAHKRDKSFNSKIEDLVNIIEKYLYFIALKDYVNNENIDANERFTYKILLNELGFI